MCLSLLSPYVELVNILLSCGEEVKEALSRSVRLQCEQNWGALCDSLSLCTSMAPSPASTPVENRRHLMPSQPEPEHPRLPRQGEKEKAGKAGFSSHPRNRSQGPRRHSPEAGVVAEEEDPKATDIRRWKLRKWTFDLLHHLKATLADLCTPSHNYKHTHIRTPFNTHTQIPIDWAEGNKPRIFLSLFRPF